MADFFLGDTPLLSGNVDFPLIGAWTAEVLLSTTTSPPIGTVTTLTMRGTSRLCTVVEAGGDYLQVKARLVAGRGALDAVLDPRDYRGYQAAQIAVDAIKDAGEVPGAWDALATYCPHWLRSQGPLRACLQRLVRLTNDPALHWRVGDGGAVSLLRDDYSVVVDTTPAAGFAQMASWGQERLLLFSLTDTTIQPGRSVSAFGATRAVDRALYTWDADSFECRAWWRAGG